jgi:hypothetical protein
MTIVIFKPLAKDTRFPCATGFSAGRAFASPPLPSARESSERAGLRLRTPGSAGGLRCLSRPGGDFIDTADAYQFGQSESLLGEFIGQARDEIGLATKYREAVR